MPSTRHLFPQAPARRRWALIALAALLLVSLSCNLVDRSVVTASDIDSTITAVVSIQTSLAGTSQALGTLTASQQAPVIPETPLLKETPSQNATDTPEAAITAASPVVAPADDPAAKLADERLMKSAKILLFEDMSASRYIRLVKEALDRAGYFYLDVGSAKGWFKTQLLSQQDWDLVIAAGEAERDFGGEFFEYLNTRLDSGAAVIVETWDLDFAPDGQARALLDRCGLKVQSDWYDPALRVFYWTDPAHPLFNRPNPLPAGLRNAPALWKGDVGDLLELKPDGSSLGQTDAPAQILAGTNAEWTSDHGLLAVCSGGRLVLQTFRSHEYHHDDIVALWQNYVDYTLRSHFAHTGQAAPPVAPTAAAPNSGTPEVTRGATPGPDYSFPHACGNGFSARLQRAPLFQTDLFEHHALGTFMVLRIELANTGTQPVQVWAGDYSVDASLYGKPVGYPLHKAATGYLYIEQADNLWQDLIQPGETWRTSLAFDVDAAAKDWVFVLRPGFQFNETACEVRIPLTR